MSDNGWIKLHRKFQNWEWFQDSPMVHLFLHILLSANHEKGRWKGIDVERGQLITGRLKLQENTGISPQTIRTCITKLKSTSEITIKSTSRYSIITICNYDSYQSDENKSTSKSTNKLTNNQPTANQQLTTNKKNKNIRIEEKNKSVTSLVLPEHAELANQLAKIITSTKNIKMSPGKIHGWAKDIQKLNKVNGVKRERIRIALKWYAKNIGNLYVPVIESGASLCEKFIRLESAMSRGGEKITNNKEKPRFHDVKVGSPVRYV